MLVRERLGRPVRGPIGLLTQPRYFGYVMNPVSFYFCFDEERQGLEAVVLEVTNTPWGERHMYIVDGRLPAAQFSKALHVSPFMEMDYTYHCRFRGPDDKLVIHIENRRAEVKDFDATLVLRRRTMSARALRRCLVRFPFMTARVALAIYYQALRLRLKGVPFVPHPTRHCSAPVKETQP